MLRKSLLVLSLSLLGFVPVAHGEDTVSKAPTIEKTAPSAKPNILAGLKAERAKRIAALKEYIKTGKFPWGKKGQKAIGKDDPHFDTKHERTHRFRGANGELCALAYLIWQSGDKQIVEDIVKKDNHFCLGKDKNAAVEDWIRRSGLTKEECLDIQRPGFTRRRPKLPGKLKPIQVTEAIHQAKLRQLLTKVVAKLEKNKGASLKVAQSRFVPTAKVG